MDSLDEIKADIKEIKETVNKIQIDLAVQKIKSSLYATFLGLLGGIIPVIIFLLTNKG